MEVGLLANLSEGELRFPELKIRTPAEFMKKWRQTHGDDDDSDT